MLLRALSLRSVEPRVVALRRRMATSVAAQKKQEVDADAHGYGQAHGFSEFLAQTKIIIGDDTMQNPYLLPATEATGDMKVVAQELRDNGVVTIKGAIPPSAVAAFAAEHRKLVNMLRPELTSDKMIPRGKNFYKAHVKMEGGLQLRANAPGRFEFVPLDRRDGGTEVKEKTKIAELVEPLVCPPALAEVLDYACDTPWRVAAVGSLPTQPNSGPGEWHRDTGVGLFADEDLDMNLPDYQWTALFPLEEALTENGSEFVLGSHRKRLADLGSSPRAITAGAPGDVTLLNAKTLHRGLPNAFPTPRPILYVTYAAHWFQPYRDISREYWQTEGLKQ